MVRQTQRDDIAAGFPCRHIISLVKRTCTSFLLILMCIRDSYYEYVHIGSVTCVKPFEMLSFEQTRNFLHFSQNIYF